MNSSPVLLSFLGTSNYVPVSYELDQRVSTKEKFVQVALCQVMPIKPGRAFVLATRAALDTHKAQLSEGLEREGVPVEFITIPDGRNEQEVWSVFETILQRVPSAERIVFDTTHGFRSLTLLGLLAVQYLRSARSASLAAVYYGAFESLGNPAEVRQKQEQGQDPGAAPIFDLTPLVELPAWMDAISSWKTTGRPELLASAMEPFTSEIKRELRQNAPSFVGLPRALRTVGSALRLTRHDGVAPAVQRVREMLGKADKELSAFPWMTPLTFALSNLDDSLKELDQRSGEFGHESSREYLDHQLALARWYASHGDLPQTFAILREALASCTVWCATVFVEGGASFPPDLPEKLRIWLENRPSLLKHFNEAEESCRQERNKLSHAWTGQEHSREKMSDKSLDESQKKAERGIENLSRLVEVISSLVPGNAPSPPATWAPSKLRDDLIRIAISQRNQTMLAASGQVEPIPSIFLNLSNHSVKTWSREQLEAARKLGLGEPVDLEGGMPEVPPGDDEEAVIGQARKLAQKAIQLGAAGAHAAGEYSLTLALVRLLQEGGVQCFAATTHRQTESVVRDDGSTEKRAVFRFVRWRKLG